MAEDVRAEIVASVLEVVVNEGDQIGKGDTLVLLESMKMEIPVLAEVGGTVSKVSVSVGDVIQAGDLIAVISQPRATTRELFDVHSVICSPSTPCCRATRSTTCTRWSGSGSCWPTCPSPTI